MDILLEVNTKCMCVYCMCVCVDLVLFYRMTPLADADAERHFLV